MNRKDLYQSLNQIDDDILERSEVVVKRKKKPMWIKWGSMAACLATAIIVGIFIFPGKHTVQTSVGGVMREYKAVTLNNQEVAILWPWEYKTVYERFSTIIYNEKTYTIKSGRSVDEALIGDKIDICEAIGYDDYTEKEYRQTFEVWQIKGISADLMIAAKMDGQFYPFRYNEYDPPVTLGEVLDNYSLPQNLTLSKFSVYKNGEETGYFSIADDDYIWQVLEERGDAQFVEDEPRADRILRDRISFTATSESLGVYNLVFYVYTDGYVRTNIFNWAYTFYIGEDAATEIITYANKNAVKAEREAYTYSLAGTLTEIGDGYILVDDSVLCVDESDGMVFKVLTSDLRISRCIDYQKISTGSIVAISFTEPVDVEAGNIVSSAISMTRGFVYDGGIAIPE